MTLFDMITFLSGEGGELCGGLKPVLRLVGYVVLAIKIGVPIILIVVGMFDLAKAVTEKNEDKVKEAQKGLISKAVAAVLVFLVVTIVGVLMSLVGTDSWKDCWPCIKDPSSCPAEADF